MKSRFRFAVILIGLWLCWPALHPLAAQKSDTTRVLHMGKRVIAKIKDREGENERIRIFTPDGSLLCDVVCLRGTKEIAGESKIYNDKGQQIAAYDPKKEQVTEWYENGKIKSLSLREKEKMTVEEFFENGKTWRKSIVQSVAGGCHFIFKEVLHPGQPALSTGYKDYVADYTEYYPGEKLKFELKGKYIGGEGDYQVSYYARGESKPDTIFKSNEFPGEEIMTRLQLTGTWQTHHPNGQLASEVNYVSGLRHGNYRTYHPNGNVKSTAQLSRGKAFGPEREYYPDGTLFTEEWRNPSIPAEKGCKLTFYASGKPFGISVSGFSLLMDSLGNSMLFVHPLSFRHLNSDKAHRNQWEKVTHKGAWFEGRREGIWKGNYANGKPFYQGEFRNGIPEGKFEYYYLSGKKAAEMNYLHGIAEGPFAWLSEDGDTLLAGKYENGYETGRWIRKPESGKKPFEIYYEGENSWILKDWHENGAIRIQSRRDDKRMGWEVSTYLENGTLMQVDFIADGQAGKHEIKYHYNGKLRSEEFPFADGTGKEIREYDTDGRLKLLEVRDAGKQLREGFYYQPGGGLVGRLFYDIENEKHGELLLQNGMQTETHFYFHGKRVPKVDAALATGKEICPGETKETKPAAALTLKTDQLINVALFQMLYPQWKIAEALHHLEWIMPPSLSKTDSLNWLSGYLTGSLILPGGSNPGFWLDLSACRKYDDTLQVDLSLKCNPATLARWKSLHRMKVPKTNEDYFVCRMVLNQIDPFSKEFTASLLAWTKNEKEWVSFLHYFILNQMPVEEKVTPGLYEKVKAELAMRTNGTEWFWRQFFQYLLMAKTSPDFPKEEIAAAPLLAEMNKRNYLATQGSTLAENLALDLPVLEVKISFPEIALHFPPALLMPANKETHDTLKGVNEKRLSSFAQVNCESVVFSTRSGKLETTLMAPGPGYFVPSFLGKTGIEFYSSSAVLMLGNAYLQGLQGKVLPDWPAHQMVLLTEGKSHQVPVTVPDLFLLNFKGVYLSEISVRLPVGSERFLDCIGKHWIISDNEVNGIIVLEASSLPPSWDENKLKGYLSDSGLQVLKNPAGVPDDGKVRIYFRYQAR